MQSALGKLLLSLTFLALGFGLAQGPAKADSWIPPSTETRESANGSFRFTVEPSPIVSSLDYFREEVAAEKAGGAVERTPPMGLLERRRDDGSWDPVWAAPLVNEVGPVSFLVADDGRHVVTFDNWHSVGHGEDVIVIYGEDGALVRSLSLVDFLPQAYIEALPHSVSSLKWKVGAELTGDVGELLLDVLVPSLDQKEQKSVRFSVALSDGAVRPPPGDQWQAALTASDAISRAEAQAAAAREAYLRELLIAPQSCDTRDWHDYMQEAYYRITPAWLDMPVAASKILFAPDNPRHETSVGWLVEAIADERSYAGDVLVASPCHPEALVHSMRKAFAQVKTGELRETTLYISADTEVRSRIETLVGRSGARVIWLDPSVAIPQRPERIPGSPEEQAARDEMFRRQQLEFESMLDEGGTE